MKPITISGVVIHGDKRGKSLGFPTANIAIASDITEGIYAARVLYENKEYSAAAFVGAAKTFDKKERFLEVYIFDFSKDIYGKELTVTLYTKIRDNKKFDSVEELITQMNNDVEEIRKVLA